VRWLAPAPTSVTVLAEASRWQRDRRSGLVRTRHPVRHRRRRLSQIHVWTEEGVTPADDEPRGARAPAPLSDGRIVFATLGTMGGSCAWSSRGTDRTATGAGASPSRRSTPRLRLRFEKRVRIVGIAAAAFLDPNGHQCGPGGALLRLATAGTDAVAVAIRISPRSRLGVTACARRGLSSLLVRLSAIPRSISTPRTTVARRDRRDGHKVICRRPQGRDRRDVARPPLAPLRLAARGRANMKEGASSRSPTRSSPTSAAAAHKRDRLGRIGQARVRVRGVRAARGVVAGRRLASFLYRYEKEQGTGRWLDEKVGRG